MLAHWQTVKFVTPIPPDTLLPDGSSPDSSSNDSPSLDDESRAIVKMPDALATQIKVYAQKHSVEILEVLALGYLLLNRLYRGEGIMRLGGNSSLTMAVDFFPGQIVAECFTTVRVNEGGLECPLFVETLPEQGVKADINLLVVGQWQLTVLLGSDASRFHATLVADNLLSIIKQMICGSRQTLAELILLSDQQQQWFKSLNRTEQFFPKLTIAQQFEQQVEQCPRALALQFEGVELSYSELNTGANQLAHYLVQQGIGLESKVVIYADRGFDCLVAILAVMKAGAAFVPVDPVFTSERTEYIIGDCGAELILTQSHLKDKLAAIEQSQLTIDDSETLLENMPGHNPQVAIHLDNLAYILYTSGSTGQPKGVLVAHCGVTNLVWAMSKAWQVNNDTRYLQFASMSFDASVPEWATTLTHGGCVIFKPSRDLGLGEQLLDLIEQQITIMKMPAAALTVLPYRPLPNLKVIITAGDACNQALVERWGKGRHFFNCYGPTEMSIGTSMYPCNLGDDHPCIGRPNYNTQVYILDEQLKQLPAGKIGEIYLTGVGITRGYNNKPQMTAEKFIPNPFADDGSRLYQSGDLGYYRADGLIEFCGRTDDQVKIRGFRVELGEIERVILKHRAIENACVVVDKSANSIERLVGYFVADSDIGSDIGSDIERQALYDWLGHLLPDYMVPSVFKQVDEFALTTNGKVDKKSLPPLTDADLVGVYEPPETELEQVIAEVWQRQLGLSQVGRSDNFYYLGGSSLNAVRICSALAEKLDKSVPVVSLLTQPLLHVFAAKVEQLQQRQAEVPDRNGLAEFPASKAQQRLYFMYALQPGNAFYNICLALKVNCELDGEKLAKNFEILLDRHESLHTRFYQQGEEIFQQPVDNIPVMTMVDLSGGGRQVMEQKVQEKKVMEQDQLEQNLVAHGRQLFDLYSGELCSAKLFKLADDEYVVSIVVHHIAADGRSIQIMANELMALYAGMTELAPVRYQAVEFALWERLQLATMTRATAYWQSLFSEPVAALRLADPKVLGTKPCYQGNQVIFSIGDELAKTLHSQARHQDTTLFNFLLAVFAQLLSRYSDAQDVVIGVPMLPELPKAFDNSVGLFANTLPVRIDLAGQSDFGAFIRHVSTRVTEAFTHQQLPLQDLVQMSNLAGDTEHNGLFQVLFAYQQVQFENIGESQLDISPCYYSNKTAKYGLTLLVDDLGAQMQCRLEYDSALVSSDFANAMAQSFIAKLENRELYSVVDGPAGDSELILVTHQIAGVARDKVALKWAGGQLDYGELNYKTDALAEQLQARGVKAGSVVALAICRDNPMLVMLELACLKIGAPLLAISEKYPRSRVEYMLSNSQSCLLVTDKAQQYPVTTWDIHGLCPADLISHSFVAAPVSLDDVAYVAYTSGTTGQPKGIEVCHRTLANLVEWQCQDFKEKAISDVLQFSAVGFDVALQELLYALADGCCYHLRDADNSYDFKNIARFSEKQPNSVVFMPTALFHQFATYLAQSGKPCRFKAIVVAGEALKLSEDVANKLAARYQFSLYNQYGPAESHVVTSMRVDLQNSADIHIGQPINRTRIHILDSEQQPVVFGRQGEVYIGGINLARGYLGDAAQSAAKFIDLGGERLYATGDLGRLSPDGNIDYIGRKDNQIKIRGFRVEPEEVSKKLESLHGVQQALVIGTENPSGEPALAAYFVAEAVTLETIKAGLSAVMPEYMIPTAWSQLSEFAINAHGKVEHSKLPTLVWDHEVAQNEGGELDTLLAQVLAELWQEVLGAAVSDSEAHFFRFGGHSLKLMQLAAQIEEIFELEIEIARLMECPRLAQQCTYLDQLAAAAGRTLESELMEAV